MKLVLCYLLPLLSSWPLTLGAEAQLPWSPRKLADATTPVCADSEDLFELQINLDRPDLGLFNSYRVFTESTDNVHAECNATDCHFREEDGSWKTGQNNVRLCLPKDQCHTFVMGKHSERWMSCSHGDTNELLVKWGGEIIRSNNAYLFDSVDFGDGCLQNPRCDQDQEVEFEFFLGRFAHHLNQDPFAWSLTEAAMDDTKSVFLEGQVPYKNNIFAFIYERTCVPRSSCLEFYMGYPSNVTSTGWFDTSQYSIRLDGVIYSEFQLRMGLGRALSPDKLNQTVNLGNKCNVETICDPADEDLFSMEFATEAVVPCGASNKNKFNSSSAIATYNFPFMLEDPDGPKHHDVVNYDPYIFGMKFSDFEVNKSYASMVCIPNDKCAQFFFGRDNPVVDYKVFQNGRELTERVFLSSDRYLPPGPLKMTRAGNTGACPSESSGVTLSSTQGRVMVFALTLFALLNVF